MLNLYRFFVKLHIIHPPAIAVPPCQGGTTGGYYYVHLHTELVLHELLLLQQKSTLQLYYI
ncbi:hypothetical protein Cal7507_2355 [Calothrix sp. PCC 7507]|nr:hypothetical protein Cal7507_2355 [Calothrix sp. PCC 7507]